MSTSGQVVTLMITKICTALLPTSPSVLWKFEETSAASLGRVEWQRFARKRVKGHLVVKQSLLWTPNPNIFLTSAIPNNSPNFKTVLLTVFNLRHAPTKLQRSPSGQVVSLTISKNHTALEMHNPNHMSKSEEDWVNGLRGVEWQRFQYYVSSLT